MTFFVADLLSLLFWAGNLQSFLDLKQGLDSLPALRVWCFLLLPVAGALHCCAVSCWRYHSLAGVGLGGGPVHQRSTGKIFST